VAEKAVRKLIPGINDLKTVNPALALEADGWDPRTLVAGSGKKMPWICSQGHQWIGIVGDRHRRGDGCLICLNKKILVGFNDLKTTHSDLSKEAHGWNPTEFIAGSSSKLEWKCLKGHIWKDTIQHRTGRGSGCPICINRKKLTGVNDLATTHPELAKEADGWDPTEYVAGSNTLLSWVCKEGHRWLAKPNDRSGRGTGCGTCSNQILKSGFNDLATTHPDVAEEADGWDPTTVIAGSHSSKGWVCKKGHRWSAIIKNRSYGTRSGCPICSNHTVQIGFNDLATTHPEVARFANGWDPKNLTAGSNKKTSWKCDLGHVWEARVHKFVKSTDGCPICGNHQVLAGFNDLTTTHPELALEAFEWDPSTLTFGSGIKVNWICKLGHVWGMRITSRTNQMQNCPYCGNQTVLPGFNDFATKHPELVEQAIGWDTSSVTPGSNVKQLWRCGLGHEWKASPKSRTSSSKSGCPTCSKTGFDPNADGWLYLLNHPDWEMTQIGITNHPDDRLRNHRKLGWEVVELRGPMDGLLARKWESSILKMLTSKGVSLEPNEVAGRFDGHTESWLTHNFRVKTIKELMFAVEQSE
jgi:hypothetical protein